MSDTLFKVSVGMSSNPRYETDYRRAVEQANKYSALLKASVVEILFVCSFVANLMVGKFLHTVSTDDEIHNYFNDKGNLFNQFFVKKGWFWTTVVITTFYSLTYIKGNKRVSSNALLGAVAKYIVVTVWWVFFTQWFFGLPIMDKVFVWTGGRCANVSSDKLLGQNFVSQSLFQKLEHPANEVYESSLVTSYACRRLKGSWEGGHDPSGHVFLLIHSSLYLVFETAPFWNKWSGIYRAAKTIRVQNEGGSFAARAKFTLIQYGTLVAQNPQIIIVALISLWWWMLFMTSLYFHSIAEKFVGLVFAYVAVFGIYYLPRWTGEYHAKSE